MNEQQDREQEWMDRWERRGRFWSQTVIGDFVKPTLSVLAIAIGLAAVVVMFLSRVTAWEPYSAALGLATAPVFAVTASAVTETLRSRDRGGRE